MPVEYRKREKCILCSDVNLEYFLTTEDFQRKNKKQYDIVICPTCGLGYTTPYPTEDSFQELYLERDKNVMFQENRKSILEPIKIFFAKGEVRSLLRERERERDYRFWILDVEAVFLRL
jgi:hypothetical protein